MVSHGLFSLPPSELSDREIAAQHNIDRLIERTGVEAMAVRHPDRDVTIDGLHFMAYDVSYGGQEITVSVPTRPLATEHTGRFAWPRPHTYVGNQSFSMENAVNHLGTFFDTYK